MASVDVAKALNRVDLQRIPGGLRRKGIGEDFLNYIQYFDTMATTVLQYKNESPRPSNDWSNAGRSALPSALQSGDRRMVSDTRPKHQVPRGDNRCQLHGIRG